jgi:serine-type D-Ala-D-Ala carboxypeptidase (penicillin-binding protein 5/6)
VAVTGARIIPRKVLLALALAALMGLVAFQLLRPLPVVAATTAPAPGVVSGTPPSLPWPAKGEAAVGTAELGLLGVSSGEQPQPMASVAKLMTALVILQDKPLAVDNPGPAITIDATDVADFQARQAAGESVLKVSAGEQLSELDALQGLLIPSGNNIAAVLAKWDAGSVDAMVKKMNVRAAAIELTHTSFADTAGVSAQTTSNPRDLFRLGIEAMKHPVIARVVGQVQAVLPVAGVVYNVDYVLGQEGIIGIKTGSGPEFGANFVFASTQAAGTQPYNVYGAVMAANTLDEAFKATKALIAAVRAGVTMNKIVSQSDAVASYGAPWGSRADIRAASDLTVFSWPGMAIKRTVTVASVTAPVESGRKVGRLQLSIGRQAASTPLVTTSPLPAPGRRWRLTRIR